MGLETLLKHLTNSTYKRYNVIRRFYEEAFINVCSLCNFFKALSACGEDNPPPPVQYNITLETSSDFEITSSHKKATEGETVTLTLLQQINN